MRTPPSVKVKDSAGQKIEIKTFDSTQLIFQIVMVLLPFLSIELLIVVPDTILSFTIFLVGISLIGYWIYRNIISRYEIEIDDKKVSITAGYPFPVTKEIELGDIFDIIIKRRSGKVGSGGRNPVVTRGPDVDDYYIVTKYGEDYLMIPKCTRSEKAYVRYVIFQAQNKGKVIK